MPEKALYWVGSALDDLRAFPDEARREAGFQLHAFDKRTQRTREARLGSRSQAPERRGANPQAEGKDLMTTKTTGRRKPTHRGRSAPIRAKAPRSTIRRGSGNVFADLGFPPEEAAHLQLRSNLMIELSRLIEDRNLTQAQAAALFGVSQPRVSDLIRGKIERFSVDTLVAMLGQAGARVELIVHRKAGLA